MVGCTSFSRGERELMSAGLHANVAMVMPALRGAGPEKGRDQVTGLGDEPSIALLASLNSVERSGDDPSSKIAALHCLYN